MYIFIYCLDSSFKITLLRRASTKKSPQNVRMSFFLFKPVWIGRFWLRSTAPACLRRWHCSHIHPWWTEKCGKKCKVVPVKMQGCQINMASTCHTLQQFNNIQRSEWWLDMQLQLNGYCTLSVRRKVCTVEGESNMLYAILQWPIMFISCCPSQLCVAATSHMHFQIHILYGC